MSRHDHGPQFNAGKRAGMVAGCALSAALLGMLVLVSWLSDDDPADYQIVHRAHPNGVAQVEGLLHDGERTSKWTYRHENGQVSSLGHYAHGKPSGSWVYWHENGLVRAVGSFQSGSFDGEWVFFDHAGAQIVSAMFERGRLVTWRRCSSEGVGEPQPPPMLPEAPDFLRDFEHTESR